MLLRHVTVNEIVHAIDEIMGDTCDYHITLASDMPKYGPYNGGYYVSVNNSLDRVFLYYADTFYQKLNDYCAMVERGESYPE